MQEEESEAATPTAAAAAGSGADDASVWDLPELSKPTAEEAAAAAAAAEAAGKIGGLTLGEEAAGEGDAAAAGTAA